MDIDLQTVRESIEPNEREKALHRRLVSNQRFASALLPTAHSRLPAFRFPDLPTRRVLRSAQRKGGLPTCRLACLSARQVRRIEQNGTTKSSTLTKLADAHHLDINTYLNQLAETLHQVVYR